MNGNHNWSERILINFAILRIPQEAREGKLVKSDHLQFKTGSLQRASLSALFMQMYCQATPKYHLICCPQEHFSVFQCPYFLLIVNWSQNQSTLSPCYRKSTVTLPCAWGFQWVLVIDLPNRFSLLAANTSLTRRQKEKADFGGDGSSPEGSGDFWAGRACWLRILLRAGTSRRYCG